METFLERYFAAAFVLAGLSHAVQPRAWAAAFAALRRSGHAGLIIALVTLPQGLVVVLGHNVWTLGAPLILTLMGWAMTVKGSLYLLLPALPDRVIPAEVQYRRYMIPGVVMVAMGLALGAHVLRAG